MPKRKSISRVRANQLKKNRSNNLCLSESCADVSSSSSPNKRLKMLEEFLPAENTVNKFDGYVIADIKCIENLMSVCSCPDCGRQTLHLSSKRAYGFAVEFTLKCGNCDFQHLENSSKKIADSKCPYEVNRRIVKTFTDLGKGHSGVQQFAMHMNTNCMDSKTFNKYLLELCKSSEAGVKDILNVSHQHVIDAHRQFGNVANNDGFLNITVSYDASWQKRGFSSNFAVGCVIDVLTGFVIDYAVLSKICRKCVVAKSDLGENSAEFNIFMEGHSAVCEQNHKGSSTSMEMQAAITLWNRSEKIGFRYTKMVSDGDAKTFAALTELKPYGPNITLQKEECVNHICKRMGTALRNVVKDERKRGVTLGGKKYGMLKETTIKNISRYYRNAIISNKGNLGNMKSAVYAITHHCMSTDKNPNHRKCPMGKESWCFYNRAIAHGKAPGSHLQNVRTPLLPAVVTKIMPIFQRLASDNFLKRCLSGRTQN